MTEPDTNNQTRMPEAAALRETARREAVRLARERGAESVSRPMFRGDREPAVLDVEPLTGAALYTEREP